MATISHVLLVTFFSLLFSGCHTAPTSAVTPTVTIDSGPVVGTTTSLSGASVPVTKYLGIPFAASPTRFAPAVRPSSWQTPLNATKYGPACVQQFNYPEADRNRTLAFFNTPPPPAGESEDCLNLNVYVPATPGKNKTVLVWIYGGALTFGSNSNQVYDGTGFAANQDVIIVSINYRTNVFGFPNSPELPLAKRNLGYLDQRFALDWIQRNIYSFGGDPQKVTIFGESAGAASVDTLVTTYPKNPPFRAAIMQSGQTTLYTNVNNAPTSWLALSAALNCTKSHPQSNLTCVRSFPASVVKSTIEHLAIPFTPVSDNVTNLRYPAAARVNGSVAPVPILTGNNADEGTIFVGGAGGNASQYLSALVPNQPALVATILSAYPNTTTQLSDILTDYIFQCPAGIAANDTVTGGNPAWRYFFNASFANTQLAPGLGVYHASEIPIVWGTYPRANATNGEVNLSAAMQASWANFAKAPKQGPGFTNVPTVGVWGNGVGLKGDGSGRLNSTVQSGVLDRRCGLYRPLYVAQGLATSSGSGGSR